MRRIAVGETSTVLTAAITTEEEAMVYIGCDQHKQFCQLAVLNESGTLVEEKKFYHSDPHALREYFASLPPDSQMAIEASGFESWLADFAQELGIRGTLSHLLVG